MTVKELVERLQGFAPDLEVRIVFKDCNPLDDAYETQDTIQITGASNERYNGCYIITN